MTEDHVTREGYVGAKVAYIIEAKILRVGTF